MKKINVSASIILIAFLTSFSAVAEVTSKEQCIKGDKFHKAAAKGDTKFLQSCLDAGTPVDSVEGNGWTALHAAAFNGKDEIVTLLLKSGAVSTLENNDGKTPLDLANSKEHKAVVGIFSASSDSKADSADASEKVAEALRFELNNYGPNSSNDSVDYQVVEILDIEKSESDSAISYIITVKFKTGTADDETDNTVVYRGVITESAAGHFSVSEYKSVEAK